MLLRKGYLTNWALCDGCRGCDEHREPVGVNMPAFKNRGHVLAGGKISLAREERMDQRHLYGH